MNNQRIGGIHYGRALSDASKDFKTPQKVIWEYVANSLEYIDENLEKAEVNVTIDHKKKTIIIEDNARGMSSDVLSNNFFRLHGENIERKKGKIARGKYGTGKSACFGIAHDLTIETVHNGLLNILSLNLDEALDCPDYFPIKVIRSNEKTDKKNGTIIKIKDIFIKGKILEHKVIEKIEQEISFENLFQRHSVFVNYKECKPRELRSKHKEIYYPQTEDQKKRFGDSKLIIRIAEESIEKEFRGIKVLTHNFYRATSLGGLDNKDLIEYIFGEVDVPMLDDDQIRQPAFKSDRSGQLDLDSDDGQLLNAWIGTCVEIERKKLVKERDERKKTENSKKLDEISKKFADLLNQHLKENADDLNKILAKNPGSIDNIKEKGVGQGVLTNLILGGEIGATETNEDDYGHGDGVGGTTPSDNELGKKLKKEDGGDKKAKELVKKIKPKPKGGFSVTFEHHGENARRAKYVADKREIQINLDHPQINLSLKQVNNNVEDINFRKIAYEAGIQEYALAITQEQAGIETIEDTVDDAAISVQKITDELTRKIIALYE